MTLSSPSSWAAATSSSMPPKSSADVAAAASTPLSVVVSASFSGAAQPAAAARVAIAVRDTSGLAGLQLDLQGAGRPQPVECARAEPRRSRRLGGYSRVTAVGTTDERAVWPAPAVLPRRAPTPRRRRCPGRIGVPGAPGVCIRGYKRAAPALLPGSRWSSASTASSRPSRPGTTRSATCPRCGGSWSSCSSRSSGRSPGSLRAGRSAPRGGTVPTSAVRARSPSTTAPAVSRPPTPPPTRRS